MASGNLPFNLILKPFVFPQLFVINISFSNLITLYPPTRYADLNLNIRGRVPILSFHNSESRVPLGKPQHFCRIEWFSIAYYTNIYDASNRVKLMWLDIAPFMFKDYNYLYAALATVSTSKFYFSKQRKRKFCLQVSLECHGNRYRGNCKRHNPSGRQL